MLRRPSNNHKLKFIKKREIVYLFAEVEATPQTKICYTDLPRTEQANKDVTHSLSIIEVAVQRRCCVMRLGINHIKKLAPDFSEPPALTRI